MQIEDVTLSHGLVEYFVHHLVQLEQLGVLTARRVRLSGPDQPAKAFASPIAVEIVIDAADVLGQGGQVAHQRHEGPTEFIRLVFDGLQYALEGDDPGGLVAVHPADAQQDGAGPGSVQPAKDSGLQRFSIQGSQGHASSFIGPRSVSPATAVGRSA